ncbi:MAG TPA: hypothetical protein VK348_10375, partial [Planctomycetota bacterium]|nr:hypothetical protein [Planctomycetota bacterium]
VLASLVAMALLLWLAFAGGKTPPAAGPMAEAGSLQESAPDAALGLPAQSPERSAPVPAARTELPVPKQSEAAVLPPDPRIHGLVSRAGLPVGNREVHVLGSPRRGGTTVQVTRTDAIGQYDFVVPGPGSYRVRVAWDGLVQVPASVPARRNAPEERQETAAAHKEIEVQDQPIACDLELPAGSLRVTANDAKTRLPLANVEVAMTWATGTDLTGHTNLDGEMLALDLPAGPCTVSLALRGYRAPPPLTVDTGVPCEERQLLLEPACILDLRVCDERGSLIPAEAAPAVEVVHAVTGVVHTPRRFRPSRGGKQPPELQFDNLEPGPYGVRVADQVAEQNGNPTVRFESVEALAPLLVTVVPERAATAEFRVRCRGYVEIRGETRDQHASPPELRVELLDTTGIRRALPAPQPSLHNARPPQFAGYLADGTYWLTFAGPQGQLHRESLQVAGKGIKRSFKLPW